MTRSPFRKSYLDLLPAYKPYAFEFFLDRPSMETPCNMADGNQQKHLLPSFVNLSFERLINMKVILFLIHDLFR